MNHVPTNPSQLFGGIRRHLIAMLYHLGALLLYLGFLAVIVVVILLVFSKGFFIGLREGVTGV